MAPSVVAPRKKLLPHPKIQIPCSRRGTRNVFHTYGSQSKKSTCREAQHIVTRDLENIILLAASLSKAQGYKCITAHCIATAKNFYFARYRYQEPQTTKTKDMVQKEDSVNSIPPSQLNNAILSELPKEAKEPKLPKEPKQPKEPKEPKQSNNTDKKKKKVSETENSEDGPVAKKRKL